MNIRNPRSLSIILIYLAMNFAVVLTALQKNQEEVEPGKAAAKLAPEFTHIEGLEYFHLRSKIPQLSVTAEKMRSLGDELSEFESPQGVYNYLQKNQTIQYEARKGVYLKKKDLLTLDGEVQITSDEAEYFADSVKYFLKQDLILGSGNVVFKGEDLKTKDKINITSETMRANPGNQFSIFQGKVKGSMERKKKYEGRMTFSSQQLQLEGVKSLAHLEGDVNMHRDSSFITAGKADIYLENYNKSLKYFVLNDDVKVTETVKTETGLTQRKAYAERLEGFGREQKMILSGAPRVEQGADVVKGYRITIREDVDLIEVDDAMSDMQVKKQQQKQKN
jgi:lipopolysaccharide transport protein LptA